MSDDERAERMAEALRLVRDAILNADPKVLTDTLWVSDIGNRCGLHRSRACRVAGMSTEPDAALVEAWLAGRDAAAAVCNDRADEWDNIFSDAARFGLVEALQCREAIRALQPPALTTLPDPRDAEIARLPDADAKALTNQEFAAEMRAALAPQEPGHE